MYQVMVKWFYGIFLIACLFRPFTAQTEELSQIVARGTYQVRILDTPASRFESPNLLGTHSLWWGYQTDLLVPGSVHSYELIHSFFRTTGGIVRYGGGANEIPWSACYGPVLSRMPVKAVNWAGPMKCKFGVPEYLDTMRSSSRKEAWLIANIAGIDHRTFELDELVNSVGQAASALKTSGYDFQRYWELGNELERGQYGWSPELIASRATLAAREILRHDPDANLVLPLIEYDDPRQPARKTFNEILLRAMKHPIDNISLHLYYDGAPGGPSVPTQIKTIVDSAALARNVLGRSPAIWITEHGRWPEGDNKTKDWQRNWYKTNDMNGVLATADFLIALAQLEDVAGAMLHGLRAGPWNVFDKTPLGPEPTGVGKLLLLFANGDTTRRLQTYSSSQNISRYKGGYDMRATAFESADRRTMSLWLVNRAPISIGVNLVFPNRVSDATLYSGTSLYCPVQDGRCKSDEFRMSVINKEQLQQRAGSAIVTLPAGSATSLSFRLQE